MRGGFQQADAERPADLGDQRVLRGGEIGACAVEAVGPEGGAGLDVGELHGEAHLPGAVAQAALHDVAHPELPADGARRDRPPLVGPGRAMGDDEGAGRPGEIGGEVLGDLLGEVILLRVAALVGERQDDEGQRRPRGLARNGRRTGRRRHPPTLGRDVGPGQAPGEAEACEEQGGEAGRGSRIRDTAASGDGTA